jgi:hypothetical protein
MAEKLALEISMSLQKKVSNKKNVTEINHLQGKLN